ncbi:diguanylate cyclase [bacterium]|nr:diguanylate cyclase [bacterium]
MSNTDRTPNLLLAVGTLVIAGVGAALAWWCLNLGAFIVPLLLLGILGMVVHLMTMEDLSHTGFLNLAFYLAVMAALAPDSNLPLKPSEAAPLAAAGRWGLGACVLVLGMLPRLLRGGLAESIAYMGANSVRWLAVGGAMVGVHMVLEKGPVPLIAEGIAGVVVYALVDAIVVNKLMDGAEESDQRNWTALLSKSRFSMAFQVLLGVLAAGFAGGLSPTTFASQWLPLAVAGVTAVPMVGFVKYALKHTVLEEEMQDVEELSLKIRGTEFETKKLRDEKENLTEDVKKKNEELNIIYDLARSLGASTNLSETTALVQSMIRRLRIPYQSCVIFLSKPGGGLDPALADTPYQEVLGMSGLLQLQEPFILQVLRDPRPYMNNEVSPTTSEQRIFKDERSLLVVPLMVSKENVGIIYLGSVNARTHKEEHLEKLKMLAAFAAPSIKTALLFEHKEKEMQSERDIRLAVEAKNHQLNGLQQLGAAIGASLKIDNTFRVVAENIKQMIPTGQSVILFGVSNADPHVLKAELINSPYSDYVRSLAVRNDEGILGKATELNRTLLIQDTEQYELQNLINNERSVIVAPLRAEEEILGLLYVGGAKERAFTEEHRSLVETVSYQASIAVKNALLYEQTQQMAFTDGLTGLYLHRFFQVRLVEEIAWADRYKKSICLVMVDADKFKQFNDTLGHPAGDALLQEIASLLKDKVRTTDIVCRYGGDEFALILKDTPKDEAIRTCERIRETFQLRFAAAVVQVTSSIGLACYPTDALNKKDLAKAADDALYVSKREGRNRVTAAPTLEEKKLLPEIVQETLPR